MLRPRVELEPLTRPPAEQATFNASGAIRPVDAEDELDSLRLPRDHPKWVPDGLAISQRARRLLGTLRPVAMRVLTFWDHRIRTLAIGSRSVQIDPSGSYRVSW